MARFAKIFLVFSLCFSATINVYTYDSFVSRYGPAQEISQHFSHKNPQCTAKFHTFGDANTTLNRLILERKNPRAHIFLGLDNYNFHRAKKSGLFAKNSVDTARISPEIFKFFPQNDTFLPFDFSAYSFVYKKNSLKNPPKSLRELISNQNLRVLYADPRTSSAGHGLIIWMNLVFSDATRAFQDLARHTITVAPGWSEAYGAFLRGEGDVVLSYVTSPLFHQIAEKNDNFGADLLEEGTLLQIELAAKTTLAALDPKTNACAEAFLAGLLDSDVQRDISLKNVAFPVIPTISGEFSELFLTKRNQIFNTKILDSSGVNDEVLRAWIAAWQEAIL